MTPQTDRNASRPLWLGLFVGLGLIGWSCSGDEGAEPRPEPLVELLEQTIEFETSTFPGQWLTPFMPPPSDAEPAAVSGRLLVPPTEERLPLVILTHGCGGVGGSELGMSRELEAAGIASFVLDSFGGRGLTSVCSGAEGVNQASLLVDLYRAVDTLAEHPYVDESKIAVMGFSMGGRTALWSGLDRFQERYGGRPLAGQLAFYPLGCYVELERELDVTGGPIRIFHGQQDDWLPISQCEDYVARVAAGGVDIDLFAYEDAHHGFDDRGLTLSLHLAGVLSPRNCTVVETDGELRETTSGEAATPAASCVERGGTIAYNPEARERAIDDVMDVLDSMFAD